MPVIFEHPGGLPRFHIDDGGETLYEYGTNRAVGFVAEKTVFALDGTPAFWIGEDDDDRYLHPFDAAQPLRYYFVRGLRQLKREAKRRGGLLPGEIEILVLKVGRRAALEVLNSAEKKQRSAPRR
jgi:hypothetical protein